MATAKTTSKSASKADAGGSKTLHGLSPYVEKKNEEYMNEKQRAHFKEILKAWRSELMEEVDRTVMHMKDEAANFPDPGRPRHSGRRVQPGAAHPRPRAQADQENRQDTGARRRRRLRLLRPVRLSRSAFVRLEARPTADLCVDCKTLDEIKERADHRRLTSRRLGCSILTFSRCRQLSTSSSSADWIGLSDGTLSLYRPLCTLAHRATSLSAPWSVP